MWRSPVTLMRCCSRSKLGRPSSSNATISPSSTHSTMPSEAPRRAQFGVGRRHLEPAPAVQANAPALYGGEGADAVPLDLECPVIGVTRKGRGLRQHRGDPFRQQLPPGVLRRVHAVDHPVLAARLEQHVAPRHALAPQHDDHLVVTELLLLEGARVPDAHQPAAVLALGDLAGEIQVLQRMVLGADGEPVLARVGRDALRQRPRGQHAVVLEAQVPVQRRGVVLLDHEPALAGGRRRLAVGLGRRREVATLAVLVERHGAEVIGAGRSPRRCALRRLQPGSSPSRCTRPSCRPSRR